MAEGNPVFFGYKFHQIAFDFDGILVVREANAAANPRHVGIDNHPRRNAMGRAEDNVCRLAADTRQSHQGFQFSWHPSFVFFHKLPATRLDVLGVLVLSGVFIVWVGIIIFRQHMAGADVEIIRAEAQEGAYRINLNTASGGELMLLPGIGKIRAARILAAREEHGVFRTMAQAREAAGMTEPQWQEVETMTTLGDGDKGGE